MSKSKSEIWSSFIQAQSESGMTIKEWCNQEKINYGNFRRWKMKLKNDPDLGSSPTPVQWVPLNNPSKQALIKVEANGITIEVNTQFDSISELVALAKEVQAVCLKLINLHKYLLLVVLLI